MLYFYRIFVHFSLRQSPPFIQLTYLRFDIVRPFPDGKEKERNLVNSFKFYFAIYHDRSQVLVKNCSINKKKCENIYGSTKQQGLVAESRRTQFSVAKKMTGNGNERKSCKLAVWLGCFLPGGNTTTEVQIAF